MARAPLADRTVIFLALLAAGCGNLNPIRARPPTENDGAATGHDALLGSDSSAPQDCPNQLIGFATMSDLGGEWDGGIDALPTLLLDGSVTGGGPLDAGLGRLVPINASDSDALDQFRMLAGDTTPGPLTILLKGMISIPPTPDGGDTGGEQIRVSSNKTILGADGNSGLFGGGLGMTRVSNVIVQNMTIARPNTNGAIDAIHIEKSHQIWIDHCDVSSNLGTGTYDGLIDISDHSDFVTVSWTHYHDHKDSGLVGRSDTSAAQAEDAGTEHVTYSHDWFSNLATGPRIRFGTVHVLNGFFDQVTNYGIAATDGANVRIEANNFRGVAPVQMDPDFGRITTVLESGTAGYVDLRDNVNYPGVQSGNDVLSTTQPVPSALFPYLNRSDSMPDSAASVPALVTKCAGTGKILVPTAN